MRSHEARARPSDCCRVGRCLRGPSRACFTAVTSSNVLGVSNRHITEGDVELQRDDSSFGAAQKAAIFPATRSFALDDARATSRSSLDDTVTSPGHTIKFRARPHDTRLDQIRPLQIMQSRRCIRKARMTRRHRTRALAAREPLTLSSDPHMMNTPSTRADISSLATRRLPLPHSPT
jgi:hypothetical protein